jgi:hypothetical protein
MGQPSVYWEAQTNQGASRQRTGLIERVISLHTAAYINVKIIFAIDIQLQRDQSLQLYLLHYTC